MAYNYTGYVGIQSTNDNSAYAYVDFYNITKIYINGVEYEHNPLAITGQMSSVHQSGNQYFEFELTETGDDEMDEWVYYFTIPNDAYLQVECGSFQFRYNQYAFSNVSLSGYGNRLSNNTTYNTTNYHDIYYSIQAYSNTNTLTIGFDAVQSSQPSISIGSASISNMSLGTTPVNKLYMGSSLLWERGVIMPTKGDLILLDMTGSGTPQEYRVLKNASGTIYEVLAMTSTITSAFNKSGSSGTYENSAVDICLNTTWYNTLSNTAKVAIVDKTFTRDGWYWNTSGDPDYNGTHWYSASETARAYQLSLGNATYESAITRHVYALSVQDIIDYLEVTPSMTTVNTTLTAANIWEMFFGSSSRPSTFTYPWLRSAAMGYSSYAVCVYDYFGSLTYDAAYYVREVRPAFQIDLSKISFTIE